MFFPFSLVCPLHFAPQRICIPPGTASPFSHLFPLPTFSFFELTNSRPSPVPPYKVAAPVRQGSFSRFLSLSRISSSLHLFHLLYSIPVPGCLGQHTLKASAHASRHLSVPSPHSSPRRAHRQSLRNATCQPATLGTERKEECFRLRLMVNGVPHERRKRSGQVLQPVPGPC